MKSIGKGLGAALALAATSAFACGYCVDDKVAAAYDYAVVARAFERHHEVAFLSLELARPVARDTEAAIRRSVERITGVDRGTVRVALEAGALSLAFDPRRAAPGSMLPALDRALAPLGVTTALLRFGKPDGKPPSAGAVATAAAAPTPARPAR